MSSNFVNPTGREALNDHKVDALTTKNNDMKLRRVINASPAINANDYVIKSQVDAVQSSLTNAINQNSSVLSKTNTRLTKLVSYGTHADRLNMQNPPDGAVFFETDNNNVEYQYQNNAWVIVGGTSGTALTAVASVALTLTTGYTAVLGTSLNITVPGTYLVIGNFSFVQMVADFGFILGGNLSVYNTMQASVAIFGMGAGAGTGNANAIISQTWIVNITSVPTSINLAGVKTGGTGGSAINSGSTVITAVLL